MNNSIGLLKNNFLTFAFVSLFSFFIASKSADPRNNKGSFQKFSLIMKGFSHETSLLYGSWSDENLW